MFEKCKAVSAKAGYALCSCLCVRATIRQVITTPLDLNPINYVLTFEKHSKYALIKAYITPYQFEVYYMEMRFR
jgi:hypothetical protein